MTEWPTEHAGKVWGPVWEKAKMDNEVDLLRDHCRLVIARMEGSRRELAFAKSKLDEMIYWLRLAREKEGVTDASQRHAQGENPTGHA